MQCKNCHTTIEDNQNFCFECGAKNIRNRLRPKVLIRQINEQFLSIDNKFLKTFIDLFKKPEEVINGYINGTRKKYIDVLQYFAIALTLVGIQVFLMDSFFTEELNSSFETLKSLESNSNSKNNPFNINLESFDDINRYQSVLYVLTIPVYALASWLVNFIIRPNFFYNFTEHLVLNIYYYAQVIIITALLSIIFLCFGLDYLVISGVVSLLNFIYHFYTLKKVFKLDFWNGIAFYLLVMVVFGLIGFVIAIILLLIAFFSGFFDAIKK
ncbi:DUF3667 domain-containing protein [Winogradskyella vincentii]|uniref:DUF3667 domain-containing protein n=1 Tax=Winogradskyella vincentii TaxID=2877122 RepID=A0ABS7Y225_9FLAO|nr:DUF3667 domain-containing protein [Winogradskyella vincentii]MCA0153651.1 DUF3667 domain-containing protein [Winogradskyella vincentii]